MDTTNTVRALFINTLRRKVEVIQLNVMSVQDLASLEKVVKRQLMAGTVTRMERYATGDLLYVGVSIVGASLAFHVDASAVYFGNGLIVGWKEDRCVDCVIAPEDITPEITFYDEDDMKILLSDNHSWLRINRKRLLLKARRGWLVKLLLLRRRWQRRAKRRAARRAKKQAGRSG